MQASFHVKVTEAANQLFHWRLGAGCECADWQPALGIRRGPPGMELDASLQRRRRLGFGLGFDSGCKPRAMIC